MARHAARKTSALRLRHALCYDHSRSAPCGAESDGQAVLEPRDRQGGWNMKMSLRALSLGVTAIFAVGTVVLADPPTVSVQQQAELIPGLGIVVRVVVDCGADPTDGTIEVGVR